LDWNFTEIDERRNVRLRYTDEPTNSPLQIVNRHQQNTSRNQRKARLILHCQSFMLTFLRS